MTRKDLISAIEKQRNSRVLTYITSDRPGPINARVAMDIIPILSRQLRQVGKVPAIDLVLYSAGGDTMVPWRLVAMLREYCDKFSVLIPYKAHSAATMIALGADEIVMTDLSEISPIDPSTFNIFNPVDPANLQNKIAISVEDVIAYFDLAKNKFGITNEAQLGSVFNKFVEANPQIHPLALGNVNRIHNLIRLLAKRLLKSHTEKLSDEAVETIVEIFTEKLYSHTYFIGRKEAKEDLGLNFVTNANSELSNLLTQLYEGYAEEIGLGKPWNPEDELGVNNSTNRKDFHIAYVESTQTSNRFTISMEFKRQQVMVPHQSPQGTLQIPQDQVGFRVIEQGWR